MERVLFFGDDVILFDVSVNIAKVVKLLNIIRLQKIKL